MKGLPSIRFVTLTESLYQSTANIIQFTNQCDARITEEKLNFVRSLLKQSLDFYSEISAVEPWIGYVSVSSRTDDQPDQVIGCCGFKGNPNEQMEVEIAYHTFPEFVSRGFATAMADGLYGIAKKHRGIVSRVVAHTLPETSASTSVLKKNGFTFMGDVDDPDDGKVWRWVKPVDATNE